MEQAAAAEGLQSLGGKRLKGGGSGPAQPAARRACGCRGGYMICGSGPAQPAARRACGCPHAGGSALRYGCFDLL